jgi:hypothetical protein
VVEAGDTARAEKEKQAIDNRMQEIHRLGDEITLASCQRRGEKLHAEALEKEAGLKRGEIPGYGNRLGESTTTSAPNTGGRTGRSKDTSAANMGGSDLDEDEQAKKPDVEDEFDKHRDYLERQQWEPPPRGISYADRIMDELEEKLHLHRTDKFGGHSYLKEGEISTSDEEGTGANR